MNTIQSATMHSTQDRDISLSLSCFIMKLTGIWLETNRLERILRKLAVFYSFFALVYGLYVDLTDIYKTWGDVNNGLYMSCNLLCIALAMYKIIVVLIRKAELEDLVVYARRHFWHSNYDSNEKILIEEYRTFYTYCVFFTVFITKATVANYIIHPLVANIGRNKSNRVLPFTVWSNLPLSETPYYELIFTSQIVCVYQIAICYIGLDNFLCLLNTHVACQFRILQYRMTTLCPNDNTTDVVTYTKKCHTVLKGCIQQHQSLIEYCKKIEHVFTLLLFGHWLVFSILICLDGYLIFLADLAPPRRCIFICHLIGSSFQLLLFTNSAHGMMEQSMNVGVAAYSGPWTTLAMSKAGQSIRKDLKLIIMRSQRPCCLTAAGYFPVSLETSTSILSTAMSYFTLLRESS